MIKIEHHGGVFQIHPLIDETSSLGSIPPLWLKLIEPKIIRPGDGHWIWDGQVFPSHGLPKMKNPETGKPMSARSYVAHLFWEFADPLACKMACGVRNCLKPGHMVITLPQSPIFQTFRS